MFHFVALCNLGELKGDRYLQILLMHYQWLVMVWYTASLTNHNAFISPLEFITGRIFWNLFHDMGKWFLSGL